MSTYIILNAYLQNIIQQIPLLETSIREILHRFEDTKYYTVHKYQSLIYSYNIILGEMKALCGYHNEKQNDNCKKKEQ